MKVYALEGERDFYFCVTSLEWSNTCKECLKILKVSLENGIAALKYAS